MKRLRLLSLVALCSFSARAGTSAADRAYHAAAHDYYRLKSNATQRKYRDNWLKVAKKFDQVAKRYPNSPQAPEALYTAAQLYSELSQISRVSDDLQAAITDYQRLLRHHPKCYLADDAAYWLAKAQLERLEEPEAARKTLVGALRNNPHGDLVRSMRALLAAIPADEKPHGASGAGPSIRTATGTELAASGSPAHAASSARGTSSTPVARRHSTSHEVALAPAAHAVTGGVPMAHAAPSVGSPSHAVATVVPASHAVGSVASAAHAVGSAANRSPDGDESADGALASSAPSADTPPGDKVAAASRAQAEVSAARAPAKAPNAKARLAKIRAAEGGEVTLAEQLGLKVRKVVIDAGHGGHDSGAIGPDGVQEKAIALAIAKQLALDLTRRGLEVVLTRDDDRFVRLEDRARIANQAHADLFISVHCNSAPSHKLRGIETYTLNTSSDRYSIRLAARENSTSEKGVSDLQFILADLATKANTEESTRLASRVQHNLVSELAPHYGGIRDLGTKQALFYVLIGTKMPSILVETSFLSNKTDEKRLASVGYQRRVAQAIADGVDDFLGDREKVAGLP